MLVPPYKICSPIVKGLVAIALFLSTNLNADEPRPNVLFVLSDDHAYQAIGAYGSRLNQTPHLDRLAAAGMRFDRCLVTNSICGPSRAAILTGKYSHRNGFFDNSCTFDGSQVTLPKLLQQADYQTALIGKWHLRSNPTGFDHWTVLPDQGDYYNPDFIGPSGTARSEGYVTDLITGQAIDWLTKDRDSNKPFFLMVNHKAPHREWSPGPKYLNDFRAGDLPEPDTLFDSYRDRVPVIGDQAMTIANHMRMGFDLKYWGAAPADQKQREDFFQRFNSEQRTNFEAAYEPENRQFAEHPPIDEKLVRWKYQRYVKDYLRCIASVDESVGNLMQSLDEMGLSANTVVIYSSDQGFYLGEHGWYDKRWIFEQSLRTPLLIRWPGVIKPGSTCDSIVSNLDFAQTIAEIAGAADVPEMQGRSFMPLLKGETPNDWRKSFYYHYYETTTHHVPAHFGVVTDRYKLVSYYQTRAETKDVPINQWELLDLQADPQETRSFLGEPEYQETQAQLLAELKRLRSLHQVPGDIGEPSR